EIGYHDGYLYPHDYPGNFTPQQYLPEEAKGVRLWHSQHSPVEEKQYQNMLRLWGDRFKS
ncbi:MAG: replication-associated recombination protein A, partial [Prevotella sp.]|nr:replication-associated recombination protein A [Prevotella sp.]